jgi:trypsin-like peptidase
MSDAEKKSETPFGTPIKFTNQLTHAAIKLTPCRTDDAGNITASSQCTGFYWEVDRHLYLVTNWHCLTGWNPLSNKPLDEKTGFTPTHVDLTIAVEDEKVDGGSFLVRRLHHRVRLLDEVQSPRWLEHPTLGRNVDVAVIEFAEIDVELVSQPVNTFKDFTDFEVAVADDAFILGFPMGIDGGRGFPIWKRASIASEPNLNPDGLPKVLVDTATRKGMSGAPVIAVRRGMTMPVGGKDLGDAILGQTETFLGVYSGRVDDDSLGVQIGIVWKGSVIEEIIKGGKRGELPY